MNARAVLGVALVTAGLAVVGQEKARPEGVFPPFPPLRDVHRLMRVVYPEMGGRQLRVWFTFDASLDSPWPGPAPELFGLRVVELRHTDRHQPPPEPVTVFQALVNYSSSGFNMSAGPPEPAGPAVRLAEEVDRHPEWSDAEFLSACRTAGARYCPDAEVAMRAFVNGRVAALAREFGPASLASLECAGRGVAGRRGTRLLWDTKVEFGAQAPFKTCSFTFEPFQGRVQSISCSFPRR